MPETYNKKKKEGFLLITSLFVLTMLITMVSYYLSTISQEVKISHIVDTSPQAYYLAETAISDAFWKLQNDPTYKINFETNPSWSTSFSRTDVPFAGGSYQVSIKNTDLATAIITATSTITVRDTSVQRVIQTSVFKALNNQPVHDVTFFTNDEINSILADVNIIGGNVFTNDNINLSFGSNWTVDYDTSAVKEIDISGTSNLITANMYDENNPPNPVTIAMPQIDFDSDDPDSYKSRADQIYSNSEFKKLLNDFPITTLNGITYVTGNAFIKKGVNLVINGVLVADGSIKIANGFSFNQPPAIVNVYKTVGEPSGLISKGNITVGGFDSELYVEGLMYAGGTISMSLGFLQNIDYSIVGGLIAQSFDIILVNNPFTITHNQENINDTLGTPNDSQVLHINHWEEEY